MFDVRFYMKVFELKQRLMNGERLDKEDLLDKLERYRSRTPFVYNIETTNACNMRCEMCPRTTMMTRSVVTMSDEVYRKIVEQLEPLPEELWSEWKDFVEEKYHVDREDVSENHFFLYVIPKVIVLHGYGDPLLDKEMPARVKLLTDRGIPSYFSCNPANIDIDKSVEMFDNGLGYIKYSIESTDDALHREVRGQRSNFSKSYEKILELLAIKEERGYDTGIVVTMINLNKRWQHDEFEKLQQAFAGLDVYVYLKSQDQMWYEDNKQQTNSLHWTEFCQFPWSSMTIKSNGEVAECVEDYDNEIVLGDAAKESLSDIWNSQKYAKFRRDHLSLTPGIKCTERCDMTLAGNLVRGREFA